MPGLYLRGSIANITMARLTESEKSHIEKIFTYVISHPDLVRHKYKVMKEFGVTIRSDYADDRAAAESEFNIAVWRGIVALFYHRDYSFKCKKCEATTTQTQRGKPKPIDRLLIPCPECSSAEIDNPGCSEYKSGDIVDYHKVQEQFKYVGFNTPTFKSCIAPIPGARKYDNPENIINSPEQLRRFFGEYIWNYFRQQINENKRKEHHTSINIAGPADKMVVELIQNLCLRMSIDFNKHHNVNNRYSISVSNLLTPPEFSMEILLIKMFAQSHGIEIYTTDNSIEVKKCLNAPTINITVTKAEHITVVDNQFTVDESDDASGFSIEQIAYKTTKDGQMDQEDQVVSEIITSEMQETSLKTRESLPNGDCKMIFDIYMQTGPTYESFQNIYGDGQPKINNIAQFLGITPRAVKQYKNTIRINCLANDFVPT